MTKLGTLDFLRDGVVKELVKITSPKVEHVLCVNVIVQFYPLYNLVFSFLLGFGNIL